MIQSPLIGQQSYMSNAQVSLNSQLAQMKPPKANLGDDDDLNLLMSPNDGSGKVDRSSILKNGSIGETPLADSAQQQAQA